MVESEAGDGDAVAEEAGARAGEDAGAGVITAYDGARLFYTHHSPPTH